MTDQEHELLKWQMRSIAQQVLLDWLGDILRKQYALKGSAERQHALKAMRLKLSAGREDYSTMTLPELHPAESDQQTALFQEAFDELSKKLLNTIEAGVSKSELLTMIEQSKRGQ
jgi:hypothetical protein